MAAGGSAGCGGADGAAVLGRAADARLDSLFAANAAARQLAARSAAMAAAGAGSSGGDVAARRGIAGAVRLEDRGAARLLCHLAVAFAAGAQFRRDAACLGMGAGLVRGGGKRLVLAVGRDMDDRAGGAAAMGRAERGGAAASGRRAHAIRLPAALRRAGLWAARVAGVFAGAGVSGVAAGVLDAAVRPMEQWAKGKRARQPKAQVRGRS